MINITLGVITGATTTISIPPPVVTPPGGTVVAPTLTPTDAAAIATFGFTPFGGSAASNVVTFASPLRDGALHPGDGVAIGGLAAQMDAASTYPSGAVKHALLAVHLADLAADATWVGSLVKTAPPITPPPALACTASVTVTPITPSGSPVTVDIGAAFVSGPVSPFRVGPLVHEGRVRVPIPGVDHLEVVADLQVFEDGKHRLDLSFARESVNIVQMQSSMPVAPTITYGVSITDGATTSFPSVTHDLGQVWTRTFGTGLTQPVHVQFAPAALRATGVMIHDASLGVLPSVVSGYSTVARQPMVYAGGAMNNVTMYMGQTGGREDIGPEPSPVAIWLITQHPAMAQYCLWQAEGAATIPWHFRDKANDCYMSITDYPNLWYPPAPGQGGGKQGPDVAAAGTGGWSIDEAHEPDSSFIPWVLTGRRRFLDDLMAQASTQEADFNPPAAYRDFAAGHLLAYNTTSYQTQVRGQAWRLRQLVHAAAFGRDSDRLTAHVAGWVGTNLNALAAFLPALATSEGQLAVWVPGAYGAPGVFATWQQDYLGTALAAADALGFTTARTILNAMMGFLAGCMLTPDFFARDCVAYNLPVGANIEAPTNTTWVAARDALVAAGGSGGGTAWAPNTFRQSYQARRGVLAYMANRGNTQAQAALAWLLSVASAADVSQGATDAYATSDPTFFIG